MLRTTARTAVILVLAAIVAGGLYLAVTSGGPASSESHGGERDSTAFDDRVTRRHGRLDGRSNSFATDGRASTRGGRDRREEASVGRGLAGMAGTALQVGLAGLAVAALQKRSQRRGRARRRG